ncbi:MAG TPA: alpha/beta fold hydrolase [Polyangiaceae bacterium]|jgi:carboxylesterase|nr:alpha/beta fold hydrolase [Polyangiaceae bacterium]
MSGASARDVSRQTTDDKGALSAPVPDPVCVEGRSPGVVAFHGFGGTTREIELCAEVARELGLAARARSLPGHGTHARDLARTRFADWVAGAEAEYEELAGAGPVIACGISMGSLMAAHLAIAHPERVRGLVLLANAAWLRPSLRVVLRIGGMLRIPDFLMKKGSSDIADPDARQTQISYTADPVHAAIDLERSSRLMRERFALVRCPTLIIHGALDRVCPVANAWRVAAMLGTKDVRVVILPRSHHIVTRDVEHAEVARELREFFAKIAAQAPVDP